MMRVCNIYSYDLPSVGDRHCSPAQHFDFPFDIDRSTSFDPEAYDFMIFGGGGHLHIPSPEYNDGKFGHIEALLPFAERVILWGIGHNVHGSREIEYPEYLDRFLLAGFRDVQREDWTACPSCMHSAFDERYEVVDERRAFFKKGMPIEGGFASLCDNGILTIDEVVAFLGGAGTVETNSYHGAFWALLLDREVIVRKPYSSKFYGIVKHYTELDNGDLLLSAPDGYLEKCRDSNREFHSKALKAMEG